ncbi:acyltransferase family protein [Micromonospora soli]|uniref:acyltransferase family protein n=1 Tax=Micromonospora sp. NBRC 110009 TaxID=3061627 RepID=UPI002672742F|nr:acyltransferase family protein [Micromonospora sp. NBRC 110009]WKT97933.1 acyltransferase family protein [Micromonospora sp. NBRC 110009]
MDRVRRLATRTPAGRERYIDLLRALAIILVVYGHWTDTVIAYDRAGHVTGYSATPELRWAHPLTWIFQVIPVFFLVGGFANAASLTTFQARGDTATDWLLDRSARLIRPSTLLLGTLFAGSLLARLLGADPTETRTAVSFATIPLWFLCAYVAVVGLTPLMYALHRRLGFLVPLLLVALVAAGDVGRLRGHGPLSAGNFLFGWLVIHQIGFAWYDRYATTLPSATGPRAATERGGLLARQLPIGWPLAVTLTAVGLGALLLLTVVGPYPVSMLTTPGERELDNSSPPSLALLALATLQLGVILLLYRPVQRWLRRGRPWRTVIGVNAVVLTIFLWHISAVLPLTAALNAAHWLPAPPVGTGTWWAWRVPWLLSLTVILLGLLAIFGPIEARAAGHRPETIPDRQHESRPGRSRTVLTIGGYAGVVLGLLINNAVRMSTPEPLGIPPVALLAYLAGAGVLRLLRSTRRHPA